MFGLFGSRMPAPAFTADLVWQSRAALLAGLRERLAEQCRANDAVLMIAHFKADVRELEKLLKPTTVETRSFGEGDIPARSDGLSPLVLLHSDALRPSGGRPKASSGTTVHAAVLGHYPLPYADLQVSAALGEMSASVTVTYYEALDSPFFAAFHAERLISMCRAMGIADDECIELPHGRAIANAQRKYAKRVRNEMTADSIEEWFRYNVGR